jgi:hypothetical protein
VIVHEEFRQLCALATSGCLTSGEQARLKEHLASCADCREAAREYEKVTRVGVPSLALDFPAESSDVPFGWSEKQAYQDFLERLENQSPLRKKPGALQATESPSSTVIRIGTTRPWRAPLNRLLPYAAAIAVALLTGLLGYRIGTGRIQGPHVASQRPYEEIATAARAQIAELSTERESLVAKNQERKEKFSLLQAEMANRLSDIRRLHGEEEGLRSSLQESEAVKNSTAAERDALLRRLGQMQRDLELSQADLALKQKDLNALGEQRHEQTEREGELATRVAQLEELLKDRDSAVERQQDLLSYDRDIRDLMGARDLYVAEVFDVGHNGETKKPFGRVFFTKGKSLIFYAYDLDQQPGLHEASSFQAWGRRGPDASKSASLGIFYLDNSSHKRWVVKSDDPTLIRQIDAVFVTVEPKGGSQKPTGKQLLFAYLRVEPNHP